MFYIHQVQQKYPDNSMKISIKNTIYNIRLGVAVSDTFPPPPQKKIVILQELYISINSS